ncbi:MAG: immunoglobulin-like domain-containing protein [Mucilaginibacter sp.]|uniref:immunoglobulin-like domain-containing protein n=1 Tax=Mucilaginibacter sp. TaxID=1882438 RepID=UPI0031AE8E6A
MKNFISYITIIVLSVTLFSCKKDSFTANDKQVGISKVTYYAEFKRSGSDYVYVKKGDPFVEPGIKAEAGGAELPVKTTGVPNTNTAGVYLVTYTAVNADGFAATASRTVVVYDTDASAAGNDFSGNYARDTNGSIAEWTKVAPGVYKVFNPGGAPGTNLTVIIFNKTGYSVVIPNQIAGGAATSSGTESSVPGAPGKLASYKMQIINPGYGTAVRTFIKQ